MRRMSIAALMIIVSTTSGIAQLSLAPLSPDEVRMRLFAQRVIGEYSNGQNWAEKFNSDGTSLYVENERLLTGKMHFEGKRLCFTYNNEAMTGGCFEIWPRGSNCFDFYAQRKEGLPATLNDKRFGRGWDARAWVDGSPSTCQTEHIS